ncbi:MAG: hypothetical protein K6A41_08405 [Bacteroidales bacterium]|nr:hypothetical protein [Bacteroidales bacterium]
MNQSSVILKLFKQLSLIFLLCIIVVGCTPKTPVQDNGEDTSVQGLPCAEEPGNTEENKDPEVDPQNPNSSVKAEKYLVNLDATKKVNLNEKGKFIVGIGLEGQYHPTEHSNMVHDSDTIESSSAAYARITPDSVNFKFEPKSKIVPIVPTGSEVVFIMTPLKEGTYDVSATIELFDNEECTGIGIPKASGEVSVMVTVDRAGNVKSHFREMGSEFWKQLKKFWAALLVIVFGALLFVIRKFVKKNTGYTGETTEKTDKNPNDKVKTKSKKKVETPTKEE